MGTRDTWGKPAKMTSCSGHEEQTNSSPVGCREGAAAPEMAPSHIPSWLAHCLSNGVLTSLCLPVFTSLFLQIALMINTLGYPQSLPIRSSAFTVPNSVKASQGGLKEDHSSLQALSCSTSSVGLSNGWVRFCTPAPQSFCIWI